MNFDPGIADAIEKKASTAHNALLMAKDEIARLTQKEEPASCWPWSHEWSKWQDRYAVAKESTIHGGVTATGCEETAMTTDLSNKTVEELRRTKCFRDKWGCIACTVEVVDELIRRLEEAQQRIALAKAEALEEAIERLWERVGCEEYGHAKAAVTLDIEAIRELAAEYREKAGRKE